MKSYRYCPFCGQKLIQLVDEGKVRLTCPGGDYTFFKNPRPTASAFIIKNDEILLAKRRIDPFAGGWDIPGGFMEEYESPVDTLKREIKEETGLLIEIIRFVGIFMDTYTYKDETFPTVNLFYEVKIIGGSESPSSDVSQLEWIKCNNLQEDILVFNSAREALRELRRTI